MAKLNKSLLEENDVTIVVQINGKKEAYYQQKKIHQKKKLLPKQKILKILKKIW